MKKRNKVILIVLSSIFGVVVLFVGLCFWAEYSFYSDYYEFADNFVVEYRTPEELSGIAGVSIPRAELIDSCFIDHYSMGGYTIKAVFAISQNDHKSLMRKLSRMSAAQRRWVQNEKEFSLFFYPDLYDSDWSDGIDTRKVELNGEMVDDWDGTFFEMTVPKDSCRIILGYGWLR